MNHRDNHQAASFPLARRAVLRGILAAPVTFNLTGCSLPESASYRFRMTVDALTPAGVKSGSSVMEESASREIFRTSETGPGSGGTRGEAVVIDLPDGPLFVLLKLPDAKGDLGEYVTEVLDHSGHFAGFEPYFAAVKRLGGWFAHAQAELPREDWPMMVRFRDINDPKSVKQVDPATAGVKRILLETTRDEITKGIEKRLPWIIAAQNFRYSGTAYGDIYPLPSDAFRSGLK